MATRPRPHAFCAQELGAEPHAHVGNEQLDAGGLREGHHATDRLQLAKTGRASDHAAVSWRLAAMNGFWCSSISSMFSQWTMAMPPGTFATCWKTEKIWSSPMPWMPLGEISRPL